MGRGATRITERLLSSQKLIEGATTHFESSLDVSKGGVLIALPALLGNGLLKHINKFFKLPHGYYKIQSIFMTLALMVLLRVKTIENIKTESPGEFGKLLGLDRIPEIRTIREKLDILSKLKKSKEWSSELSKEWFENTDEHSGVLYIDGFIRVYHGSQTKLPKRYVSRERLCLSGTSDYWVNDIYSRPFFYVSSVINSGLIEALRKDIVPRLLNEIPNQPDELYLKKNPDESIFTMVFDREGYSPDFIREMWEKRIACTTYKKYVKDKWLESEFEECECIMPNNEKITMLLAERKIVLKKYKIDDTTKKNFIVREIRKLTESGHQTSIISTDFKSKKEQIAVRMFSRWSQENFFKFMTEHFGIDRVIEIGTEELDGTKKIVNPEYKNIESQIKKLNGIASKKKIKFAELSMENEPIDEKKLEKFILKKSELKEKIDELKSKIIQLKELRKATDRHIQISELPEEQKFSGLIQEKKHIIDLIKMIAYRTECTLASIIKESMAKSDKNEAKSFLRMIYKTEADILPDYENKILFVSIHNFNNIAADNSARHLFKILNESETIFPSTELRLFFKLVSDKFP